MVQHFSLFLNSLRTAMSNCNALPVVVLIMAGISGLQQITEKHMIREIAWDSLESPFTSQNWSIS